MNLKIAVIGLTVLLKSSVAFAQDEPLKAAHEVDMYSLSLEELMNMTIVSASKKEENLFDAPLSSFTITRADLDRAGCTSLMDALRLAPGVLVREVTNGIYDTHIRGFDNVTRFQPLYQKSNYATLIMIDNRPVYHPISGGAFWEALPIDLNDVERIEIVRGPAAPLFGPNAVSGVINIITRKPADNQTTLSINGQGGNSSTGIFNAYLGKQIKKWTISASGNFQQRGKYDDTYFSHISQSYVPPSLLVTYVDPASGDYYYLGSDSKTKFPNEKISLQRSGINAQLGFRATENIKLDLSIGTSTAEAQKIYSGGAPDTYFNTVETKATYANLALTNKGLKIRASINSANDNANVGGNNLGYVTLIEKYDYTLSDVVTEYEWQAASQITITPGVSYQSITFDDTKYHDNVKTIGLFNGNPSLHNISGHIRSDVALSKKIRVVAAIRADKFSAPDEVYFNYELATTFKINDVNLLRFALTRANSGSYIGNNYQNLELFGMKIFSGNTDLKLFTIDAQEIGFRSKLSQNLQLDVDLFRQTAKNFVVLTTNSYRNSELEPTQLGLTMCINYAASEQFQIKPFITLQQTTTNEISSDWDKKHTNTPGYYGGYYLNYHPLSRLNINLNGYYFKQHRQYDFADPLAADPENKITGKIISNLKVSGRIYQGLALFINARNAFNASSREFYRADKPTALYLAGISFNLN